MTQTPFFDNVRRREDEEELTPFQQSIQRVLQRQREPDQIMSPETFGRDTVPDLQRPERTQPRPFEPLTDAIGEGVDALRGRVNRFFEPVDSVRVRDVLRETFGMAKSVASVFNPLNETRLNDRFIELKKDGLDESTALSQIKQEIFAETLAVPLNFDLTIEDGEVKASGIMVDVGTTGISGAIRSAGKQAFSRIAMTTNADDIARALKESFPTLSDDLVKRMSGPLRQAKTPLEVEKKVNDLIGTDINSYIKMLAEARESARGVTPPESRVQNFYDLVKIKMVEQFAPIEDTLSRYMRSAKISLLPSDHITNQIDRVLNAKNMAGQFLRNNGFEDVVKNANNLESVNQYLIARHTRNFMDRGIDIGGARLKEKDRQMVEFLSNEVATRDGRTYQQVADQISEYSNRILDYAVDTGIVNRELAARLKQIYPDYVPINRVFTEVEKSGPTFGARNVASLGEQTIVRRLTGSEREIENVFDSLIVRTVDAIIQGERNKTARMLAGYRHLPGNPFQLRRVPEGESAKNTISFLENGEKITYETIKEVADSAKNLNPQQFNILAQIGAMPVRLLKLGTTGINIPFTLANVVRDQAQAIVNSFRGVGFKAATPTKFYQAVREALTHGRVYQEMVEEGAMFTNFDIARNQVAPTLAAMRAKRDLPSRIIHTVTSPKQLLRAAENIIGRSEEVTRIQQFISTRESMMSMGYSKREATIIASRAAREVTANFMRRGEFGSVLNAMIPYLNASIQGVRAFVRSMARDPVGTTARASAVIVAPMTFVTLWNLGSEDRREAYMDIAEYEKENNFVIIPPNPTQDEEGRWNVIKIPIMPGISGLSIMPRKIVESVRDEHEIEFRDFYRSALKTVSPVGASGREVVSAVTPQILRPTLEAMAGERFFTGAPIIPRSMEGLSPEHQRFDHTSGTVARLSNILGVAPIHGEQFIRGHFGQLGSQGINAVDNLMAMIGVIPAEEIGGQSIPEGVVGRFTKAYGGEIERSEAKVIRDITRMRNDERFTLRAEAESLHQKLSELESHEANQIVAATKEENEKLFEELKKVVQEERRGLTYPERLMMQLGVQNGDRARYINQYMLENFDTSEERNEYLNELRRKKVISDNVLKQLKAIIKEQK
jgi:hypothetical protein